MEENINERLSELGTKILATTRNELYIHMRFLDVALSSFAYVIDPSVNGVGTDGMCMFYHPGALGGMYRQNRVRMNRAYLHMVLHCILPVSYTHLDVYKRQESEYEVILTHHKAYA